jgi:hypothetical protein
MRRWVLWLYEAERRLCGDTLQGNAYFASLVVVLSMFAGAALCERDMLVQVASLFVAINGVALAGLMVVLSGFILCESICVGRCLDIIIIRSLAVMSVSVLAALLGYLLGWPLLLLSVMWLLAILVFVFMDLKHG